MKKTIITITIILIAIITMGGICTIAPEKTNEVCAKLSEETIRKEITEITAHIGHNNVIVTFDDGTYLDSNWDKFFFTETYQRECVIKKYDENKNLVSIHIFYNPDTTILQN